MNNQNEFIFSCSSDDADLYFLQHLFIENGIKTSLDKNNSAEGQMGTEEILLAIIETSIIPSVITAIGIWLSNRKKELVIEDKNKKRTLRLISKNGKSLTSKEMEDIKKFFDN